MSVLGFKDTRFEAAVGSTSRRDTVGKGPGFDDAVADDIR
jgi:hypothetical protein